MHTPDETEQHKTYLKVYTWLSRKAKVDGISAAQLLIYSWIYARNTFAQGIYTKNRLKDLQAEMESELPISDIKRACLSLIEKGWIEALDNLPPHEDRPQRGYRCLLASGRAAARADQQQQQLTDEAAVVTVESVAPPQTRQEAPAVPDTPGYNPAYGPNVFYIGGDYYYDRYDNDHRVPGPCLPRPSATAIFDTGDNKWYEPDQVPIPKMEF